MLKPSSKDLGMREARMNHESCHKAPSLCPKNIILGSVSEDPKMRGHDTVAGFLISADTGQQVERENRMSQCK